MQHSDLYFYPLQSPIYLASNDMKHILMLNISGVLSIAITYICRLDSSQV